MSTSSSLILLGVLLVLFPFIGLPDSWLHLITPLLGLIVFGIGFSMRNRAVQAAQSTMSEPSSAAPEHHDPSPIS